MAVSQSLYFKKFLEVISAELTTNHERSGFRSEGNLTSVRSMIWQGKSSIRQSHSKKFVYSCVDRRDIQAIHFMPELRVAAQNASISALRSGSSRRSSFAIHC